MGRPKKELKRIHRRKVKKAKNQLRLYSKGEIAFDQLTALAKHLLKKRKKQETKPA